MSRIQTQQVKEIKVSEGGNLSIIFSGAVGKFNLNGHTYSANEAGLIERVYEVGQRLRDGTVVLSVDPYKNKALFVPEKIFGGKANFDNQDDVVQFNNRIALHSHKDWRLSRFDECETLCENWWKVAPEEFQGYAAPWFWTDSPFLLFFGRKRRGGDKFGGDSFRLHKLPVPIFRTGPARSIDI